MKEAAALPAKLDEAQHHPRQQQSTQMVQAFLECPCLEVIQPVQSALSVLQAHQLEVTLAHCHSQCLVLGCRTEAS